MADANTAARGADATASVLDAPASTPADPSASTPADPSAPGPGDPLAPASGDPLAAASGDPLAPASGDPLAAASGDVGAAASGDVPAEDHASAGYLVDLAVFKGPFDLLLQLIARRRLDITEVDLADITADFLASLKGIDQLDLESATHFLVVAATLVELKAARLLPREQAEELEDLLGEARDLLYARLLEYRAFRDVAHDFNHRLSQYGGHHGRTVPLDPQFRRLVPDADLDVTVDDLARLAALATAPRPEPTVRIDHIRRTFITIQEAAQQVLDKVLAPGDRAPFTSVVKGQQRTDAIVFFLAMLELYKLGHLDLDQPDHRGELILARREATTDLSLLAYLTTSGDPDDVLLADDAPQADTPRPDAPKADTPRPDAPKADTPRPDAPQADAPQADARSGQGPDDDVAAGTPEPTETP